MQKIIPIILLVLTLSSCALPYQKAGLFTCGYIDSQIDKNTFIVTYSGGGMSHIPNLYKYSLIRAAEVAKSHGYDYFIVISNETIITSEYSIPTSNMTIRAFNDEPLNVISFKVDDILKQKIADKIKG